MTGFFQEQYDRMIRSSKNLTNIDDIIHFVQDCYHLKDWIKNDPAIVKCFKSLSRKDKKQSRNRVEEFIDNSDYLKSIADIANASKHLILTKPPRTGDKNVDIIKPLSAKEKYRLQQMSNIPLAIMQPFKIKVNSGYICIDDLAKGAIEEWDKFLSQKKLNNQFGKYKIELFKKNPKL